MTNTRVSALDFHTAKTTRLSLRLGTLGQKSFSIPKSGEIETLASMERCLGNSKKTLKNIPCQKFRGAQFPNSENLGAEAIATHIASRRRPPLPTPFDITFSI